MNSYKYYKDYLNNAIKENDLGDKQDRNSKLNQYYARKTLEEALESGFTKESFEYCDKWNCCYHCPFFDEVELDDDSYDEICTLPEDIVNYKNDFIEKCVVETKERSK